MIQDPEKLEWIQDDKGENAMLKEPWPLKVKICFTFL